MMSSASPETYVSESGLRAGHRNIYHLFNKVPDVSTFCLLINTLLFTGTAAVISYLTNLILFTVSK